MSEKHDSWAGPFGPVPSPLPDNASTLSTLLNHVSVRQFKPVPVEAERLAVIHEAIRRAPTSSAMQSTLYITITDRDLLAAVRPHVGGQLFIETCAAFIVGCMDLRHLDRATAERGYTNRSSDFRLLLTSLEDVSISVQNAAVAAEAMGLGTVMVGGTIDGASELVEMLGLPHRVVPLLGLAVGWSDQPPVHLKPRLPRPIVFHKDRFDVNADEERRLLDEHDQQLVERGYYDGRHISWEEINQPGTDEVSNREYGWQEHAARKQSRSWWSQATPKLIRDLKALGWNPRDLLELWSGGKPG